MLAPSSSKNRRMSPEALVFMSLELVGFLTSEEWLFNLTSYKVIDIFLSKFPFVLSWPELVLREL